MNNDGFLLIDTLLAILTFSIIVTILVPALITLVQADKLSEQTLELKRDVYISLVSNDSILIDEQFFKEGVICRVQSYESCLE